ncbi:MAG: HAD-IA family hydrolase [Fimbriimonadaceae bacterium]|nr:HAD-IA family hydrolase [Fimbriimonadaceae bacterium]
MPRTLDPAALKAVLYDVDGTLVDSLGMILGGLGDGVEHFEGHRPSDEWLMGFIGLPLTTQTRLFTDRPLSDDEVRERVAYTISRYQVHEHRERPFVAAIDSMVAFKRSGYAVGLVTSRNRVELQNFLVRFPARESVDTFVCASDVTRPKPDAEPATLACARLGVHPSEALFVGDSVHDAACAKSAGCPFAAVSYGASTAEALRATEPDLWFETPEDLLAWTHDFISLHHAKT